MRLDGEPRLAFLEAARILRTHSGLAKWATLNKYAPGGWNCRLAANEVATRLEIQSKQQHLQLQDEHSRYYSRATALPGSRLKRQDWMALIELILTSDDRLAVGHLGRVDFTPWPPAVKQLLSFDLHESKIEGSADDSASADISPRNTANVEGTIISSAFQLNTDEAMAGLLSQATWPIAPLTVLCARLVAREPFAFEGPLNRLQSTCGHSSESATVAARHLAARYGSGSVVFHSGRIAPHDPVPSAPKTLSNVAPQQQQRRMQRPSAWSSNWPYRILSLVGKLRMVHQAPPEEKLGTGAHVWGGALALCEELERRDGQAAAGATPLAEKKAPTPDSASAIARDGAASHRVELSIGGNGGLPQSSCALSEVRACRGLRVLELGAGLGLGSLCASLLGAQVVVSTDLAQPSAAQGEDNGGNGDGNNEAVSKDEDAPSLLRSIALNRDTHAAASLAAREHSKCATKTREEGEAEMDNETGGCAAGQEWRVQPLWWGNAEQASKALESLGGVCDLVLASECAYDDSAFNALFATLNVLCHSAANNTTTTAAGAAGAVPPRTTSPSTAAGAPRAPPRRATEVLACHYPRIQAGGDVPELNAFEERAVAQGFHVQRREVMGAATGVTYVLHSLTKSPGAPGSHE